MPQQNRPPIRPLFFSIIGFVGLVMTLIFYDKILIFYDDIFQETTPTPTTSPTSPPTDTPTQPSDTTPPILLPPPTLEEPENDDCLDCGSEVTLRWSLPYALHGEECYQLRVQEAKEQEPACHYPKENSFSLPTSPSPGEYSWVVSVVHPTGGDEYVPVSEESTSYTFVINPPPIVHSISPTSTVQGISVTVVISGENLTLSLTLTIDDISLQTTLVDSSTITATVPIAITQDVDEHTVIVEDSTGNIVWSGSLTVEKPPTVEQPPSTSPIIYSAPTLLEPEDDAHFNEGFWARWQWQGEFGENEYFALRVYPRGEAFHSLTWTRDQAYHVALYGEPEGDYCWHVVVLRGTGPEPENWVEISPRSEERCFYAAWPKSPPPTPPTRTPP